MHHISHAINVISAHQMLAEDIFARIIDAFMKLCSLFAPAAFYLLQQDI
jgi:hypothetical protein